MPRYVILRHDPPADGGPPVHWDLMLEAGDRLRTWALEAEPRPGATVAAVDLADHRVAYLDYEGPISGNRGTVARWDRGTYSALLENGTTCRVQLTGSRWSGVVVLRRCPDDAHRWMAEFSADEPR